MTAAHVALVQRDAPEPPEGFDPHGAFARWWRVAFQKRNRNAQILIPTEVQLTFATQRAPGAEPHSGDASYT